MVITTAVRRVDSRRRCAVWRVIVAYAVGSAILLGWSTGAPAQAPWRISPTISAVVTATNNVDLAPKGLEESDVVLTVRPGLAVQYVGPRGTIQGSVGVPIVVYARTGDVNNKAYVNASLRGDAEIIRDLFFVDASADVSQTYFSPFGPTPPDLATATDNRYTSQRYRVTPYLQGRIGSDIGWSIRNDNIWTNLSNSPDASTQAQYINRLFGTINRTPRPFGWGADVERNEYRFGDQQGQVVALARARATWQPRAQLEMFVSAGYEATDFPFFDTSGAIYGAGLRWRPTDRTRLDASWEHRFYGESYDVAFEHRRPLSFWNVRAYRTLSSYPERVASIAEGSSVAGILDRIFQSRIPDPAERTEFIADFMADRGLPEFTDQPISIYSERLYVLESATASVGLLGVRNSLVFRVFRSRQWPITGAGEEIPPVRGALDDNTQYGAGATWSYQLSPLMTFLVDARASRTEAEPPFDVTSEQFALRAGLTQRLSLRTRVFYGARWYQFESSGSSNRREAAIFAGFNHSFR